MPYDFDSDNEPSENDYDSDEDYLYEEFYSETYDLPKQHNLYYIGICKLIRPEHYFLLLNTISSKIFFKHPFQSILTYLSEFSIIYVNQPHLDIMQLQILPDDTYTIIKKTYWLRLIQRHWKNILLQRQNIYKQRCRISSLQYSQLHGRYPRGLNAIPGLYGMLACYHYTDNVNKYKN
jgi:hypothetical protein